MYGFRLVTTRDAFLFENLSTMALGIVTRIEDEHVQYVLNSNNCGYVLQSTYSMIRRHCSHVPIDALKASIGPCRELYMYNIMSGTFIVIWMI